MSLLDDLRAIEHFTPSHQPAISEIGELLGKLMVYVEHGDAFLRAADEDVKAREAGEPANHVNELLSPTPQDEQPVAQVTAAAPAPLASVPADPAVAPAVDDRDARIAQLEQELATAQAQAQRTTVDVTPAETTPLSPPPPAPGPDVPPAAPGV